MGWGVKIKGQRPKSKKAVKEAMRTDPESVTWDCTDFFGPWKDCVHRGDILPDGLSDTFVGPDPYTDRRFYGQLITKDGKVTVK